jgi:hypothetical protein
LKDYRLAIIRAFAHGCRELWAYAPVVVAFVYDYDYERGKSFLAINFKSSGAARAFAQQGITSRKMIGRQAWMENYFHGDLAELLILTKPCLRRKAQTTTYHANKYGIAQQPPAGSLSDSDVAP